MQLRVNEILVESLILDNELKSNINCFSYDIHDRNFSIYIFSCEFKDENDLLENFKIINNSIAFDFQRTLEKEIERWNLYFVAFVNSKVSEGVKDKFEQDRYATRKIVYDDVNNMSVDHKKNIINKKLFSLELDSKKHIKEKESNENMQTLRALLTDVEQRTLEIMNKTFTHVNKKKSLAEYYLKELLNEQKNI